jgi:hypothetical protein
MAGIVDGISGFLQVQKGLCLLEPTQFKSKRANIEVDFLYMKEFRMSRTISSK